MSGWDSWETPTGGGAPEVTGASSGSAMADMTVVDASVLDCRVCFLPLKPPIFQVPF